MTAVNNINPFIDLRGFISRWDMFRSRTQLQ